MGSGFSGKYRGTWSSPEGEELRAKVLAAVGQTGGMLAGDSVVDLAEALVRVAAGESADEVDFPEMGDVALDLALDALSAFMPGGAAATRSLSLAAKAGRGSRKASATKKAVKKGNAGRNSQAPRQIWLNRQEYAIVMSALNNMYHTRLKGHGQRDIPIGDYVYTVVIHDFDNYTIIGRRGIT